MPKCKGCGRHGLFLQLDSNGFCEACAQNQRQKDTLERVLEALNAQEEKLDRMEAKLSRRLEELSHSEDAESYIPPMRMRDPRLSEAVEIAQDAGALTTSLLQRRMRIGYSRAMRIIDTLGRMGIISGPDGEMSYKLIASREHIQKMLSKTD